VTGYAWKLTRFSTVRETGMIHSWEMKS
jgi:hypothetical protein